ncbi:MAG: response regulator [Sphaerochaeta sp.]|nr:response regulator [Sphaerochaeta sp.]
MHSLVIVDDEFEIRNGLNNYFPWEELGFHVSGVFADGESAIDHISYTPVDVLLTDIRMPSMDGLELIRRIRQISSRTICLILSGHKDFEYARQGIDLGVRHFIVKPTKYGQLAEIFTSVGAELLAREEPSVPQQPYSPSDSQPGSPKDEVRSGTEEQSLIIGAVKRYIDTHLAEATLERAADSVRLNPNYLSTYFHTHTKQLFGEYLATRRMSEARRLLLDTSMRINEIAEAVGYSNATSFSRAFRLQHGISPKEWRVRNGLKQ